MKLPTHILHTDRLIIRPFTHEDINVAIAMGADEELARYTTGKTDDANDIIKGHRIWVDSFAETGLGPRAVVRKDNTAIMGSCGLVVENSVDILLCYCLFKEYWGHGFATEDAKVIVEFGFNYIATDKILAAYPVIARFSEKI